MSFVMTLNEDYAIDTDIALASRLAIFTFTESETSTVAGMGRKSPLLSGSQDQ